VFNIKNMHIETNTSAVELSPTLRAACATVNKRIADLDTLDRWMGIQTVTLSNWLVDLLRVKELKRDRDAGGLRSFLRACAIVGMSRDDLQVGQLCCANKYHTLITMKIFDPRLAQMAMDFQKRMYIASRGAVWRTAVMAGLPLRGIEYGVITQTRREAFSDTEMETILAKAEQLLPGAWQVEPRSLAC